MKILIIGAGEVGGHLARLLSQENHDITVVDNDPVRVEAIGNNLDVLTIEGQGTDPTTLKEAGIESADMVISVTTVDEVNILSCMLAKQFGVKTKIARVRNREFTSDQAFLNPKDIGIDLIIHPELEATREIVRLIRYPQVQEMITFCDDSIAIVGMKIVESSPIAGRNLRNSLQILNSRFGLWQSTVMRKRSSLVEVTTSRSAMTFTFLASRRICPMPLHWQVTPIGKRIA